jgi:hypothetical protein
MGTQTIPTRENAKTIDETWFNIFKQVLTGDLVPRNTSGVSQSIIGSLGSSTYLWLKAHIESGYWKAGDMKMHFSYNGTIYVGHGWMKCDGRQVTQATYDAEHGAGAWATYIGSSPLVNKYLPNYTNKYPVGGAVTQDGSIAITSTGNASHTATYSHTHTLSHTHTTPAHVHQWNSTSGSFTSSGAALGWDSMTSHTSQAGFIFRNSFNSQTGGAMRTDAYTSSAGAVTTDSQSNATTSNPNTASVNVQPESIVSEFYMRII